MHSWFGGKKAKETPAAPAKGAASAKTGMKAFSKKENVRLFVLDRHRR